MTSQRSKNDKIPSRYFGDSSQLTNWILDSGATYHITPQVSDFIPGSLEYTDKYIEFSHGHYVTDKKKGKVKIKTAKLKIQVQIMFLMIT